MGYVGQSKGNLQPFDEAAIVMLQYAGIKPTIEDVKILGNDLQSVADEFEDDIETEEESATHAAHVLRERIGGYANLESYLKCLRVGADKGPAKGFYRS